VAAAGGVSVGMGATMQTVKTEFTEQVVTYLRDHHTLTLSTSSFTGIPHANTAPYVSDTQHLYFFARPESVLLGNLSQNRHVDFTVDDYDDHWVKRRELHGQGECHIADDDERVYALNLALDKYRDELPAGVLCTVKPAGMYFVVYDRLA
jgi:nitroimidazol reductase NimA-like FMN-containing flavoprotein (pyridoxamine 5'-phosphate oxidase superfamily)